MLVVTRCIFVSWTKTSLAIRNSFHRMAPTRVALELASVINDLSSLDTDKRYSAAESLLSRASSWSSSSVEQNDDLGYTLRRLVNGLCSSRDASRLGFSMAFVEVCFSLCLCV